MSEAFWVLDELLPSATTRQKEAIHIAQDAIEEVDLLRQKIAKYEKEEEL